MRAYDYLIKCPSFPFIAKKFHDFTEFSKSVEVIPWQEEFAVADHNPEVIDHLEFLEKLLEMKAITQEEFERETYRQVLSESSCFTLNASLQKGKAEVSTVFPSLVSKTDLLSITSLTCKSMAFTSIVFINRPF